ncbi:hypothetical protein REPUB_Repub05bG0052600 [Reevesia pubescens]
MTLWKLGTLSPGLISFYSTTKPLEKSWHVLGLGYNPSISMDEIRNVAMSGDGSQDLEFNASFGVVDQGFTSESITSGSNLVSMDEIRNVAVSGDGSQDLEFNASFGVVDQGFTSESITSGGNLVSNIDPTLTGSCSDFTRLGTVSTPTNPVFASSPPKSGLP